MKAVLSEWVDIKYLRLWETRQRGFTSTQPAATAKQLFRQKCPERDICSVRWASGQKDFWPVSAARHRAVTLRNVSALIGLVT